MKHRLKHDKLIPPNSRREGIDRAKFCRTEIEDISRQLLTFVPTDKVRFPQPGDYDRWAHSARQARILYRTEERLTLDWLRGKVLDELYRVFSDIAEEDLEPFELKALRQAREFLEIERRSKQSAKPLDKKVATG